MNLRCGRRNLKGFVGRGWQGLLLRRRECGGGEDLDEGWGCGLGWTGGGFVLLAGCGVEIDRDAGRNDHGGVVFVVQVAGEAVDDWNCGKEDEEGYPGAVKTIAAAGEPEGTHGVTLDDGRVVVDAADGEAEDEGAAGLPSEVDSPADPEGAGETGEEKQRKHG